MKIQARGVDPATGEPDPHGIPQIACPARQGDVNPQFTCRSCPRAGEVETHEAVDDLGRPFRVVDAVECTYSGGVVELAALWREFPSLLKGAPPRLEPGVPCPLLASPARPAPLAVVVEGARWLPAGHCRTCQFYRGAEGRQTSGLSGADAGITVVCSAADRC